RVLVSQAYADHAHHRTLSSSPARRTPPHVASRVSRLVTWVKANTKTRSKNNSNGTTVFRSSRSTCSSPGTSSVRAVLIGGDVHVAGPDLDGFLASRLHDTATFDDIQRLAAVMGVPRGASAGREVDSADVERGAAVGLDDRVDPHIAGEPVGWSFHGGRL